MDEEKEVLFLDALMGIDSELKKLNSLLETSQRMGQKEVSVFHGIQSALEAINNAIRIR